MSETKERKVVGKRIAIILGIACMILVGSLVGAFAYYVPLVKSKDSTISSLNYQVSNLQNQTNSENALIANLQNQIDSLQSQITELEKNASFLNDNITAYQTQISTLNTQISKLYSNITDLQNQVTFSNSTINLLTTNITILQKELDDLQNEAVIPVSLDELQTNYLNYVNRTILVEGNLTGPMSYIPENMPPWNYQWVNYPTHLGVYWTGGDSFDSTPVIVVGVVREGKRFFNGGVMTDYFINATSMIRI